MKSLRSNILMFTLYACARGKTISLFVNGTKITKSQDLSIQIIKIDEKLALCALNHLLGFTNAGNRAF